jgi:hypothetical protein
MVTIIHFRFWGSRSLGWIIGVIAFLTEANQANGVCRIAGIKSPQHGGGNSMNMRFRSAAQWLLLAPTSLFLAACAGGGGGGGLGQVPLPLPAPAPQIPLYTAPASDLGGSSTSYAIDNTSPTPQDLVQQTYEIEGSLSTSASGFESITVRLLDGTTQLFEQTFTLADFQSATVPSDWSAIGANKGLKFSYAEKTAPDNTTRKLLLVDPEGSAALGLQYSTMGVWEYDAATPGTKGIQGGVFSIGVLTAGADIPTTGTASYAGRLVGTYSDGAGQRWSVGADAAATANFGARTVDLTSSSSVRVPQGGGTLTPDAGLNITQGRFAYSSGTNVLDTSNLGGAPVLTQGYGMQGRGLAYFYGPQAVELGGSVFVDNGANQQMTGGFALKKQ